MLLELMCAFSRLLYCCGTQDTLFGKPKVSELFQFKLQVIFFITTNMYVSLIWIYEVLIYSFECNGMYYEEYDLIRTNYKFESGADNSALVWVFSSPYASISFSWARHEGQMEKYIYYKNKDPRILKILLFVTCFRGKGGGGGTPGNF